MKLLNLTQGYTALVDDDMYDLLSSYKWQVDKKKGGKMYAVSIVCGKRVYLHHIIVGHPRNKLVVHHKNNNGLDNQRSNLEVVTQSYNMRHTVRHIFSQKLVGIRKKTTPQYTGRIWEAYVCIKRKYVSVGVYRTVEEAVAARDGAEKLLKKQRKMLGETVVKELCSL